VIMSSRIRGDLVRGLYSKWKSSIWTSTSLSARTMRPEGRTESRQDEEEGGSLKAPYEDDDGEWNGWRTSDEERSHRRGVVSGEVWVCERDVEREREPSLEGGGELPANVKSARISRSWRSVKFQKTTTPYENMKTNVIEE
jgi:hypothetical protein